MFPRGFRINLREADRGAPPPPLSEDKEDGKAADGLGVRRLSGEHLLWCVLAAEVASLFFHN